jgi:ABC-2 type transport system ATP-binding protein
MGRRLEARTVTATVPPPATPIEPAPALVIEPAPAPVPVPAAPREAVLRCSGLVKRYGERSAVDSVGFEIARGETYGLLGPNGAGKTTTISMICVILQRDGGEIVVDGRPIGPGTTAAKAAIGFVPQDLAIYPDLTARENLVFFGRCTG